MKAELYTGKETIQCFDPAIPDCDSSDVLIENLYAMVCEEDINLYCSDPVKNKEGSWISELPGSEFGLSGISQVAECGADALDFNLGERVYAIYSGKGSAFSEFSLVKDAQYNKNLYPITDRISDQTACLIRPFAHGCHTARTAMSLRPAEQVYYIASDQKPYQGDIRYKEGETAIVFGDSLGAIACGICLLWFGMEKVMICGASSLRLELVKNFGLLSCKAASLSLPESAGLNTYDCWVDTTGSAAILSYYNQYSNSGSRFISSAENCQPVLMDMQKLTAGNRSIIGAGGYTDEDVQETISILASGIWDFSVLFTHEYSIDELDEAIRTAADPDISCCVGIHF